MKQVTESLHVLPKADVDRLFSILNPAIKALHANPTLFLQQLRGVAYANTFMAERRSICGEPNDES